MPYVLRHDKKLALQRCFDERRRAHWAASFAGVSYLTARNYYTKFRSGERIALLPPPKPAVPVPRFRRTKQPERYRGPALIGKRASAAPVPVGKDWLGKAAQHN